ncbi:MAG: AbrB/MazE/SpoVT family DNA-binding domain-containing protein [Planctomycetota bacterium]|jgi:AbrB family looped-hinge helix DNA binding protein
MISTLTSKGQITLPKKIRTLLHLDAGDKVDFFVRDDGHVELVPVKTPISDLKGMIPPPVKNISLTAMEKAVAEGAADYGRD